MTTAEVVVWDREHPLGYDKERTVATLRRLADELEQGLVGVTALVMTVAAAVEEIPSTTLSIKLVHLRRPDSEG